MFGPKKLLTMAALAMIAAAGVAGTASAQPARHDGWRAMPASATFCAATTCG